MTSRPDAPWPAAGLEGLPVNGEQIDRRHAAGGRRAHVASIALVALMNIASICFLTGAAAWRRLFDRAA